MPAEAAEKVRVIQTRKLQTDIDEELHDAFRILVIQYKCTARALVEKLILDEVIRQAAHTEQDSSQ